MTDCVVTCPMAAWEEWIEEGDLPGDPYTGDTFHFWLAGPLPNMEPGERVYICAHNRLRGYAPLVSIERRCRLRPSVGCLVRRGDAVAVTIDRPIRGFRGWRYVDWDRSEEKPFPDWQTADVPTAPRQETLL